MSELPPRDALWPDVRTQREAQTDVVGLGEISIDEVGRLEEGAKGSDKFTLASLEQQPGGTMATTLLGCARLGLRAAFIGAVGDDPQADRALGPLDQAGVDLGSVLRVPQTATRKAFIAVEPDSGLRTVYALRPQELDLDPARLDTETVRGTRLLILDISDPRASQWAASVARAAGIPVALDADRSWESPEQLLSKVDFPIVTEELARQFAPAGGDAEQGLEALSRHGATLSVMTRGEHGSVAYSASGQRIETPAFAARVVDTTGAGDAFRAGFAFGLLQGASAHRVLAWANAAGSVNCEKPGAQAGLADRSQLEARSERGTTNSVPPDF